MLVKYKLGKNEVNTSSQLTSVFNIPFFNSTSQKQLYIRRKIISFQLYLESLPKETQRYSEDFPLKHWYTDGVYCREILLPKATVIVGKIHKFEHLNIISKGKCRVITEFNGIEEFEAPHSFISKVGTKRLVYALEDTIWTTIHKNTSNSQNEEDFFRDHIAPDYSFFSDVNLFLKEGDIK